ncbi:class A beta-lactamase [Cognatiyoonia sp. IB215446]|uniref:class A beta-lactamase n=1 Tax=Cognatiyoonia sp. IB215446 TaxID=3097355 RepID=UPI002A0BBF64|nr:class A beta-lactamase [Cognatiyoonia sp. IB215446]MDX8349148.1 class A beta-lactamase [Cognatiyoonia sp. IB215446]
MTGLKSMALWVLCSMAVGTGTFADDRSAALLETLTQVESRIGGRIGVAVSDSASDWGWRYRADERFPMNSTFKSLLCATVLGRVDRQTLALDETVRIDAEALLSHAPVTREKAGQDMTMAELCYATLDKSDNTAANLLIDRLGGTAAVTGYLRGIGDTVSRLDRLEPDMNNFTPGDPRDTTTPAAMITTWEVLFRGEVLSPASRHMLASWMADGWATSGMIRPSLPDGWEISDKSGAARHGSRSIVAMITPPEDDPYFVAIYIAESPTNWVGRLDAIAEIGAAVTAAIQTHQ